MGFLAAITSPFRKQDNGMDFLANITYTVRYKTRNSNSRAYHLRRVRDLQQDLTLLWNTYLDLGSRFHRNVPLTSDSSEYDDAFISEPEGMADVRDLRAVFDPDYCLLGTLDYLKLFVGFRIHIQEFEKLLDEGDFSTLRLWLHEQEEVLEREQDEIDEMVDMYEGLIAALNGLTSAGRLAHRDPWAEQRMKNFQYWSDLIQQFSEKSPDEAVKWLTGLYRETAGDEYSDDDEDDDDENIDPNGVDATSLGILQALVG